MIIGEPVGSCTDLSATVLQPLKQMYSGHFARGRSSVLIDVRQVLALEGLPDRWPIAAPADFPIMCFTFIANKSKKPT